LGGSLSNVSLTSQVTGTLPIANGGTNATTALAANNNIASWGQLTQHAVYTDFNAAQKWGVTFIQSTTNGPGVNSAGQYYSLMLSLGSEYSWGSANVYAMQMAIPRNVTSPYVTIRYKEGGADTAGWGSWQKISAGYADTAGSATSATTATNATNVAVTADSTNATRYISFVGATSGNNGTLVNSALSYIPASGNLGIGTSSPANQLHLHASEPRIQLTTSAGGSTYSDGSWIGMDATGLYFIERESSSIRFITNSTTEAARITSAGNIGIGNTSPGAKLQVDTGAAGTKGLIVKAAANPTANLLEVQNSSGTNLVYVDSTGDLLVGVPNATYFPSGAVAPLHVTRSTTAVATAIAAWPTYEPDTQTHARIAAFISDGGNGGTSTAGTGTTNIVQLGEYYTGRVVIMPYGAGGSSPSDQGFGFGKDIMLLGGKSDNAAGRTGGRVFIQGGTGFAGAYGSNFGNVILQANGGAVCIGGTSPQSTSPGLDITADASSQLTGQMMIKRASTNDRFRLTCGVHTSNYAFIQAYENAIGGLVLSLQPSSGTVGIGNTSPGAKLQVDTVAAATKGLIVKGAASQSANLQEWQNSGGTALASMDANGNLSAASIYTDGGYKSSYTAEYVFIRAAPTTVGGYVEICNFDEQRTAMQIMAVSESGSAIGTTIKTYNFVSAYGTARNTILTPIMMARQGGYESTFDFELESWSDGTNFRLRLRRTAGTSARNVAIYIKTLSIGGQGTITSASGTGTSAISAAYSFGVNGTYLSPPPVIGGSGAGNNLTLYAGNGETSGAGGSIILQPGLQATTGGNGTVIIRQPGGTAGTDEIQLSHDGTQGTIRCFDGQLRLISADNVRFHRNGDLTNAVNVVYSTSGVGGFCAGYTGVIGISSGAPPASLSSGLSIMMYSDSLYLSSTGTIKFGPNVHGSSQDVALVRGSVGTIRVSNNSTGGGSLAFTSSTTNISTTTNNLALNGSAFQRLNCTTACNLTGVAPPTGGSHVDGRMMRIYNTGTANLTLKHNSTSSDVANRFCCIQAVDIILAPRDYAELIYDGTDGGLVAGQNNPCWRVA
jgi:hypothetical protein